MKMKKTMKIDPQKTMEDQLQFKKMKQRISKDHLQEDAEISYA